MKSPYLPDGKPAASRNRSDSGFRCPICVRAVPVDATFCPNCGSSLGLPSGALPSTRVEVIAHGDQSFLHRFLKLLLAVWLVAYPIVACVPVIAGAATGGTAGGATIVAGVLAGGFLFWPWLIGIVVIGLLTVLSR
jgi:hypothetical protein